MSGRTTKICPDCVAENAVDPTHTRGGAYCPKHAARRYRATESGKAALARYEQSKGRKEAKRRYAASEKGKLTQKRYAQSEKARATKARYRYKTDGIRAIVHAHEDLS